MDIIIILILAVIVVLISGQKIVAVLCLTIIYLLLKPKIKENFVNPSVVIPQEEYYMRPISDKKFDFDEYSSFDALARGKNAEISRLGTNTSKVNYLEKFYGDILNYNENTDWWNNKTDQYSAMYNFYK